MAESVLRWGLLSTARINRSLIPPLKKSKRNRLEAIASRSPERAKDYAREWEIPRWHGSYEALLADPEIDAIYNPLPNSMHAEWTVRAAEAGKHVLCEKPLAITLDEVDQIEAAARRNGVVIAEAFMYLHHPQTRKAKEVIDSGALGEVYLVRGSFTFYLTRPKDVRLDAALGGGSLWDVGCYPVSYARYLFAAEPEEVFGRQRLETGVDVAFAGQMRFPGERLAQFDCGFRAPFRVGIEAVGTQGSLWIPMPFAPRQKPKLELRRGDQVDRIPVKGADLYLGEVEDMADAALDGKTPRVSLAFSRGDVRTLLGLLESARTGSPVSL